MNKVFFTTGLLAMLFNVVLAKQVDENTAKQVAQTFLSNTKNAQNLRVSTSLDMVYKATSSNSSTTAKIQQTTFFYVFNTGKGGFVIVAGDDNVLPILGYSDEGAFDPSNIPTNAQKWFEEYKSQIRYVIDNNISATREIQEEWYDYTNGAAKVTASFVTPLIQTKWDQAPYYNDFCPYDNSANERAVTGCVATAMAQVMKHWNYPATGTGFHSYNHSAYGTLSANFGSTTYQWNSMPNVVSSSNHEVAMLMYHCGVSVNMDYGISSTGGSSATYEATANALKSYFGYRSSLQLVFSNTYDSQLQWINVLKNELDGGRPILYAGAGSGGGHAFICDGYDNSNFFHFNWGWGGNADGYFQINKLNPGSLGLGGGSGGYNSNHHAIIGIEPPPAAQVHDLRLYDYVSPSSNTIGYGNTFSITTNISNNGTNSFHGDYCAAIFDNQYHFIDYVEIKTGHSLQGGYAYTNNLVFSNSGLFSMLPGTYYVGIFYRPSGGNWVQVSKSGSYTNLIQMTVVSTNNIRLNSEIEVSPGTTLIQGQSISVNLNILNSGSSPFVGKYMVGLYNLDGSYVQTIGTITENNGLAPNYTYISPFLTFSNTITADPGTYLIAVQASSGNSDWRLVGSTSSFINPIKVIVQAPPLSPDQYEYNNITMQAYTLPVSFSANTAVVNTFGSNFHIGTDYDYYKVDLPLGYNYTIRARLHDSYNSGNLNTYSVDGLFSYSVNGSTWSDAYDDVMTGDIVMENGGAVYFHVAPYFAGEKGTYLLDMTITRTEATVGIYNSETSDLIKVYPNPAKDFVVIEFNDLLDNIDAITVLNSKGQIISTFTVNSGEKVLHLPLYTFPNGVYFIQINSEKGILTKKIIISS
jgi:hypothetical protein